MPCARFVASCPTDGRHDSTARRAMRLLLGAPPYRPSRQGRTLATTTIRETEEHVFAALIGATFQKVLIANVARSWSAIRACRHAGIGSVAAYADRLGRAPHVRRRRGLTASAGLCRPTLTSSIEKIDAAKKAAPTVDLGDGFLAENFAEAAIDAGRVDRPAARGHRRSAERWSAPYRREGRARLLRHQDRSTPTRRRSSPRRTAFLIAIKAAFGGGGDSRSPRAEGGRRRLRTRPCGRRSPPSPWR